MPDAGSGKKVVGVKDEHGKTAYVSGFADWSALANRDTGRPNGDSFNHPRFEYMLQTVNFWLGTTLFSVLERLGKIMIFPTLIGLIVDMVR